MQRGKKAKTSQKATKEAAQGQSHWQCKLCERKFATCKAEKRHHCPVSKEVSKKSGMEKGKGSAIAHSQPNKPAPTKKTPAPPAPSHASHPHPLLAFANHPPTSGPLEAAISRMIAHTVTGSDISDQHFKRTSNVTTAGIGAPSTQLV